MVESDWTKYRVLCQVPDTKKGKTLKINALNQTGHDPFLLAQKTEKTTSKQNFISHI